MAEVDLKEMKKNLKKWLEITEICLNLRLAYLRGLYPHKKALKILFKEIRDYKNKKWNFKKKY